ISYILGFASGIFAYPVYFISKIITILPFSKFNWIEGLPGCLLMTGFNIALYFAITGKAYSAFFTSIKKIIPAHIESRLSLLHFDAREKYERYKTVFLRRKVLSFSLTALFFLPFIITGAIIAPRFLTTQIDQNWKMAACDIGQGDSSVIKTSASHAIVIDTGPDNSLEKKCLDDLDIKTIDLLILSHFHDDHVGGIDGAIEGRDVKQAFVSNSETPAKEANMVYSALNSKNIPFTKAKKGDSGQIENVQWYTFQALEPSSSTPASANSNSKEDAFSNDSSIGTIIYSAGLKMIFIGDMEKKAQAEALKELTALGMSNFDILKVAHHGSKTQDEKLAELIHPKIAIFEVGKDNTYGHPNSKTINMFEALGAKIIRTDQDKLSGVSVDESGSIGIFKQNIL
ncbi:MAG: MBL fold metallo-hydrolase, partial [Bifidobacteriaceae bacterium]|nr:MBL fold metallo-hydrolase [Bifidobacteriaceae bacterium]